MPAPHRTLVQAGSAEDEPALPDDPLLSDPLLSFDAESDLATASVPPAPPSARRTPVVATVAAIAIVVAVALAVFQARTSPDAPPNLVATDGVIDITSQPAGAAITIDGELRGVTPLRLSLTVGPHLVDVVSSGVNRSLPVTVDAGTVLSQHIEFVREAAEGNGRLEIASDTRGAQVSVDGSPRGTTPLIVEDLAAGEHTVTISQEGMSVEQTVTIAPGATARVRANASANLAPGWVGITAPIELQVFKAGRLIGSTAVDRLMLPAGRHDLQVENTSLEFRATVRVDVAPGKTVLAPIAIPNGTLSINAFPWAEISIDGRPAGVTPLGNLSVPIGPHEVRWRHPQLGERLQTVVVTAMSPVGVGMDLTK
ncbi:MAG: PEGA domain-containing protein [Luteitalea sp.]|nr:PEGA domain-containing protein [Luteitalea sp.]